MEQLCQHVFCRYALISAKNTLPQNNGLSKFVHPGVTVHVYTIKPVVSAHRRSSHPLSVLILNPKEIQALWSLSTRQR